jgi:hypothetical protein
MKFIVYTLLKTMYLKTIYNYSFIKFFMSLFKSLFKTIVELDESIT